MEQKHRGYIDSRELAPQGSGKARGVETLKLRRERTNTVVHIGTDDSHRVTSPYRGAQMHLRSAHDCCYKRSGHVRDLRCIRAPRYCDVTGSIESWIGTYAFIPNNGVVTGSIDMPSPLLQLFHLETLCMSFVPDSRHVQREDINEAQQQNNPND